MHVTLSIPAFSRSRLDLDGEDISIYISHSSQATAEPPIGHNPVTTSHARPPDGVPIASLDHVRIMLNWTNSCHSSLSKRSKGTISDWLRATNTALLNSEDETYQPYWSNDPRNKFTSQAYSGGYCGNKFIPELDTGLQVQSLTDAACLNTASNLPSHLVVTPRAYGIGSSQELCERASSVRATLYSPFSSNQPSQPPLLKRRSEPDRIVVGTDVVNTQLPELGAVVELTDAALRSLISYRPTNLPANLKISKEGLAPSLSAIAPSIWSPGYSAVSLARNP